MADDKTKHGRSGRKTVATGERYEVTSFARKHGMTPDQARIIIEKVCNDRDAPNAVAAKPKG